MYPNPYGQPPNQPNIGFTQPAFPSYPPAQYPQSGVNPMNPPYPPSAAPGLPPSATGNYPPSNAYPGYPSNQSAPGYPPQPAGYPPNPAPTTGYPSYPPNPAPTSGYPSYPPNPAASGYPSYPPNPATSGYPSYPPNPAPASGYASYPPNPAPASGHASYPPNPTPAGGYSAYPSDPSFQQQHHQGYPAQPTQPSPHHISSGHAYTSGTGVPAATAGRMQPYQERPTVVPVHPFDPVSDCNVLRKAMKGFGTDEMAIVNVLCKRSNAQRLQIIQTYKTSFGKDLIKDLKSELGGRFEDVIMGLMLPRYDYIATTLQKAISGFGTKERVIVDCMCTSTNEEIRAVSASYARLFGRTLERDLMGDTSGHFRRLLVSMSAAGRMENQPADPAMAANDVKALYEAGAKKIGTDESVFNSILCMRSFEHLRLVFHEYERTYGISFEKVIEREFSGDIESGLKAVVLCAKNRAAYFATRLQDSFRGAGTKDEDLIFIIVTRCEIDLQNIKDEYHRNYNKSLAAAISSETSGDYKKALLALCGN